ncbi:hypothetical protein A2468_04210 [Candidatus Falkowbacteria bacterium RIFOXYC2_FULL_46_15]|uniref:Uncharacterized protein n=1 Tax=Candidatus Falkowbacteria bacterium RIFOXYA2_FULL_47_19 TaxID=1797994 RepID=A0A1F5SMS8_9BACT|nr:MAG: hypothetical protein A2227_05355 [Candidatus Falkowbacteria bacterium RIFOXYA2_FULL_47_19]OGF35156.1 MAG: hypothetical protein A2468_04210 [Candidatus Falkowbacteria bacterium RIFOXYC2_FULL_46_15]
MYIMKNFLQNCLKSLVIAIPALTISLYAINHNQCVAGISFFVDICFLTLRQSLIYIWGTVIFFVVVYFFIFRKNSKHNKAKRNVVAIIFMILSLALAYVSFIGSIAIPEYIRQRKEQAKSIYMRGLLWKNGDIITISDIQKSNRYNNHGKVEYVDISFKVTSKTDTDARIILSLDDPPIGVGNFFEKYTIRASLNQTPQELVFPIRVNAVSPLQNKHFNGPIRIKVFFGDFSEEFKNNFQVDCVFAKYTNRDVHWEWARPLSLHWLYYYNPSLITQSYRLSDFIEEKPL